MIENTKGYIKILDEADDYIRKYDDWGNIYYVSLEQQAEQLYFDCDTEECGDDWN